MPDEAVSVVHGVDELGAGHGPLLAVIGVFDGIHLGHQYLLRHLVTEAQRRTARPTVITFDSHPDEILVGAAPPLLLDPDERLRLLAEAGVEVIVVQHFDATLRMTEYDAFIRRITARTTLAGVLMTPDAAFGHDRRGTPEAVAELGKANGFDLVIVPPFEIDGRSVRSSDIRAAIAVGDLDLAQKLLGRPYAIVGKLESGEVRPSMPVARPPAGSYCVTVSAVGDAANVPATGAPRDTPISTCDMDDDGRLRLDGEPEPDVHRGSVVRVEFAAS